MEIAESYDRMPYPSKFFYQTNPDHLATIAKLLGLEPARPEAAKVLELGCGNGSNLLSHAFVMPGTRFVGLDISGHHIRLAKDSADELGLENVEFRQMDVADLTVGDFGKFDYIVAHGLISWIPLPVRDRIFGVYGELLEENGIGFISYNAYPGAHEREMVRDILRDYSSNRDDLNSKVESSLEILGLLAEHCANNKTMRPVFANEYERHAGHDASDIYHDDLSDEYHPLYFRDFAALVEAAGLEFLGEAEFHSMSMMPFPQPVRDLVGKLDGLIEQEQYLDYFRGRAFRQSLICRKGSPIDRSVPVSRLEDLLVATTLVPEAGTADLRPKVKVRFQGTRAQGIELDLPLAKAALSVAGRSWGRAIPLKELLETAMKEVEAEGIAIEDLEQQREATMSIILQIYQGTDLIDLHTFYPDAPQTLSSTPKLNRLSRWQLGTSANITSLFGLNVGIKDSVSKRLLELSDGSRTATQITSEMRRFIPQAEDVEDKSELLRRLGSWVSESLSELARLGVFES